jgi:hypothetical protein
MLENMDNSWAIEVNECITNKIFVNENNFFLLLHFIFRQICFILHLPTWGSWTRVPNTGTHMRWARMRAALSTPCSRVAITVRQPKGFSTEDEHYSTTMCCEPPCQIQKAEYDISLLVNHNKIISFFTYTGRNRSSDPAWAVLINTKAAKPPWVATGTDLLRDYLACWWLPATEAASAPADLF